MEFEHFTVSYMQRCKMLYSKLIARAATPYGLNHTESAVLLFLRNNPEYNTAKDISVNRVIAKSNVSTAVDALKARGLLTVQPDEKNRRVQRIFLTDDVQEMLKDLRAAQIKFDAVMRKGLTDVECLQIETLLRKNNANIVSAIAELEKGE